MSTEILPPSDVKPPSVSTGTSVRLERRGASPRVFAEPEVDFAGVWRTLRKRKGIILKFAYGTFALALFATLLMTPKFRSESTIQFNKQNTDSMGLEEQRDMLGDANAMDYSVTQQTQVKTLLSDSLALRVIKELNLESRPEFSKVSFPWNLFGKHADEAGLPLERAPYRRVAVLKAFHKSLTVAPVSGTRLISVEFLSPDPQIAAKVANTMVKDYKEQYFQNRYEATMEASGWLSKQLDDLRTQVESSQQRLVDYQKEAGILGTDESHNIVMTRLQDLDRQLMNAEANRIVTHTVAQLVRNGNPELVSGLIIGSTGASTSMSPTTLTHLETLRSQQSDIRIQYAQAASQYGAANPKLIELKSKLDQINETVQQEMRTLTSRAENDYLAAQQNEAALRAAFESEKEEANKLNDSAIQYTILKHEVESSRGLYDGLLTKFKEAGVLAGMRSSNIVVVDEALPADRPSRPILILNLGLGLLAGLFLGVGAAFVAENVDDKINTADDAEEIAMVPALGVVPTWRLPGGSKKSTSLQRAGIRESGICVVAHSRSQPAEAFRAIRTSIIQSTRRGISTSIVVTSSVPGEGKSTVSLNCAAAFAQQGSRVLLVEADMRRPVLNAYLNLERVNGLSSLIRGESCPDLPVRMPSLQKLSIIPAGPPTSCPAELLGSDRMKELVTEWSKEYDYILFDTPPALSVTDAVVLAPHCDIVILVARAKVTRQQALRRMCALFSRIKPRVLGVIVNGFDVNSPDFAAYYGYENNSKSGNGYYVPLPK